MIAPSCVAQTVIRLFGFWQRVAAVSDRFHFRTCVEYPVVFTARKGLTRGLGFGPAAEGAGRWCAKYDLPLSYLLRDLASG